MSNPDIAFWVGWIFGLINGMMLGFFIGSHLWR